MTRKPPEPAEIGSAADARRPDETIATTGPGLPDEALAPGETLDDELVPQGGEGEGERRDRWPALRRRREPSA